VNIVIIVIFVILHFVEVTEESARGEINDTEKES